MRLRRVERAALPLILLLAAALRIGVTWGASAHHPDEIFQYLEQAHRLVFGYGYIPWEYRDGMRSWLVPLALAAPMSLGGALAPNTLAYLLLPRLAVAFATLGIVWAAWRLGERVSKTHAIVAAIVAAIWFDQVYFAAHTLTEVMATAAALPALALLPSERRRHLVVAGALLAFAALVRFHYAPALGLAVLWRCRLDARAWGILIAGALPILAISALVDIAMGDWPYHWIVENFRRNVVENASATYGVSGPLYYFTELGRWWRVALVPLVFLALFGARRTPVLLAVAVATIALHMLIGHKELRFVFLAMTLLVILAAIGTADLLETAPRHRRTLTVAATAGWAVASLALSLTGDMRPRWSNEAPALTAAIRAGRNPRLCGLATWDMRFWQSGGYTYLHRNVPIYPVSAGDELGTPPADRATLARIAPGFDAILTTAPGAADMPPGFHLLVCRVPPSALTTPTERSARAICLYRRPGGCDPRVADPWRLR